MTRRPTPRWIDLARDEAPTIGERSTEGSDAPAVDTPRRGENDNAGAMPSFGLSAGGLDAALLPARATRGRRLGVTVALILSATIHAAAFVWLAGNLSAEGMEAETDGVSVEIVFDTPAASASPAIAGYDGATVADAAPAEPVEPVKPVEPTPAEAVEVAEAPALEPVVPYVATVDVMPEVAAAPPVKPEIAPVENADAVAPEAVAETEPVETVEPTPAEAVDPLLVEAAVVDTAGAVAPIDELAGIAPEPVHTAEAVVPEPVAAVQADMARALEAEAAETIASEPVEIAAADVVPVVAATPPVAADAVVALTSDAVDPEPAAIEASDDPLPETVDRLPEPRPAPETAVAAIARPAAPATPKHGSTRAPARAAEAAPARREARADKAPAKAAASAPTGRNADGATRAPAASAGSQARAAAAPGAEAKYGRKLLSHVERHKRYPAAARSAGISGATRLSITIDRTGGLAGARVSAGSGHQILDQEALAVARRAAPYPRPPEGVGGRTFSFAVTLRFAR